MLFTLLCVLFFSCKDQNAVNFPENKVFEKEFIDQNNGYSEAVVVRTNDTKTIYISGQIGEGVDFESQMRSALLNLQKKLAASGASMKHVVKMNTYIVNYSPEILTIFRQVRKEVMGNIKMPASTLVGVESLALPEWLIEIEAIAVIETIP
jgi:enamine deaminase RidA (YjgF/YER057c/UK114 family)